MKLILVIVIGIFQASKPIILYYLVIVNQHTNNFSYYLDIC